MRVWDLPPATLCRAHLLAQHREIHAVWTVLTERRRGYAAHPETVRWRGRLRALRARHERTAREMERRRYRHASPLDARRARGAAGDPPQLQSLAEQRRRLRAKGCGCRA